MDKLTHTSKLHFQQTSIDIFNLYKQSARASELAYNQGKEDAFEEILKYIMVKSSSIKYVPMHDFIQYLQSRYDCHRFKCQTNPQSSVQMSYQMKGVSELISQLAEMGESIAKAEGPLNHVVHKFSNLDLLKIKDSKKRRRVAEPTENNSSGGSPNGSSEQFEEYTYMTDSVQRNRQQNVQSMTRNSQSQMNQFMQLSQRFTSDRMQLQLSQSNPSTPQNQNQ